MEERNLWMKRKIQNGQIRSKTRFGTLKRYYTIFLWFNTAFLKLHITILKNKKKLLPFLE